MTTRASHSPAETLRLARALGAALRPGDAVLIRGELGAGKTTFVRGVAEGLGVDPGLVSSPTFVIVNEYPGRIADLIHVDAYRLRSADDLDSIGWDRLASAAAVMIVEWPERITGGLDAARRIFEVTIRAIGPSRRELTLARPAGVEGVW